MAGRRGSHREEPWGKIKSFPEKKKLAVRNQGEWEDLNGTVRGSLVLAVVVSLVCL